ncbi:hypothetical protein DdX_18471 [Ditylenchus destructor]|uniref:Uncharacterized protein n=1 Tax=Ditylenchus destructor TaxID=166010 RepID=A0AAD4ML61_9BILA|nr:hypothetical protein DdX_18471 [Ditylenchus destructor]
MAARGAIRGPGNWRPRRPNPALSSGMPSSGKAGDCLKPSTYPVSSGVAGNDLFNPDWGFTDVRDVIKEPAKNQEHVENKPVISNDGTHKNNGNNPGVRSTVATELSKRPAVEKEPVPIKLESNAPAPVTVNKAKASAPVTEMEALNPGWDGIDITHLINRRTNKKEVPTAKADTKTSAAVNTVDAKQSAQVASKIAVPQEPDVNVSDVTHIKRDASNQEPAIAMNGAGIAIVNAVPKQAAPITEMEKLNPGWDGIDITHLLKRRTNKKEVPTAKVDTKTSAAVNTVDAKQSAQAAQEVDDPLNPGWESIDIRHILERGKAIRPSVDSGVASVYDKTEMKQTGQNEPAETVFKSEDVFTQKESKKLAKELSEINNAGSASATSEKAEGKSDEEVTRTITVTQGEVLEFHTLTKECSEAFGNISKFLLKLGSRC